MIYYIYSIFKLHFSFVNVFQYITFRIGGAMLSSLILSYLITKPFIKKFTDSNICQNIRTDGPRTHFSKKGTPTMGGIIILLSVILSTIIWARLDNRFIIISLITSIYLGAVGFMDDGLKFLKKNSKGISARQKFILQAIFALGFAIYIYFFPSNANYKTLVDVPYMKNLFINLSYFYIPLVTFIIIGASNAVNLTDGLDGLAIGGVIFCSFAYLILSYLAGHVNFSSYLKIIYVSESGELSIFLASIIGSCLGFLWYNTYPAQLFMGDTGSLFLGGVLGVISVMIKQELVLLVCGGVFVMEALSVIIQVTSFRLYGKRVFKMAPIHHHFELLGWSEPKVVVRFWIFCIMFCLIALASLKIR